MGLRITGLGLVVAAAAVSAQAPQAPPPVVTPVRVGAVQPIAPPPTPLPAEAASAGVTRFSFVAYGDTRCDCGKGTYDTRTYYPGAPETGAAHSEVVDAMLAKVKSVSHGAYPVKFVLQSGDAVWRGPDADRWPVFTRIAERITAGANLPLFYVPGNHDVTAMPAGDPNHDLGLHNTLSAISRLIPPEGSPRRLNGYATFAFGYGNVFAIGLDSNIADDRAQLAWVTDQLERIDRQRYRHVVVFYHHPAYTSGRYSGVRSTKTLPSGLSAASTSGQPQAMAIRSLYMPLFRKHHVRLLITGHDHLFDHWVERYTDADGSHRMDQIISGGGGAPTYIYTGEPDLTEYLAAGASQQVRVEHLAKPGLTIEDNPHHVLVIQVDGDKLSVEIVGVRPFAPYNGSARVSLDN